jgi:tetratricopeptide (TPR) repeat protein
MQMMKRLSVSVILMFGCAFAAFGQDGKAVAGFSAANELYRQGNYTQAVAAYESLRSTGFSGGGLYYNLGNSYVKAGQLGKALVNYERARIFIPSDSDLKANYEFVHAEAGVVAFYRGEPLFWRWVDRLFDGVSLNGLTIFLTVLWLLIIGFLVCHLFLNGWRTVLVGVIAAIVIIAVVCGLGLMHKIAWARRGAIVIEKEASVRFEPMQTATEYFRLTEGSPVLVVEKNSGWYKVQRPDGKIGWVPQATMEMINE